MKGNKIDQRSMDSNLSVDSFAAESHRGEEDIIGMMMHEKAAAMDPEKGGTMLNRSSSSAHLDDEESDSNYAIPTSNNRQESEASIPGAFRVRNSISEGDCLEHDHESIMSDSDDSSQSSESCIVIIPRASLVKDDEDGSNTKDTESSKIDRSIPVAVAEEKAETLDSVVAVKSSGRSSRCFRCCVLLCLSLVAILLAGLIIVLRDKDSSNQSSQFNSGKPGGPNSNDEPLGGIFGGNENGGKGGKHGGKGGHRDDNSRD